MVAWSRDLPLPGAAEWPTCRFVGHRRAARDRRRRRERRTSRGESVLQVRSLAAPTALLGVRESAAMQKRPWRRLSTLAPRRGRRMRAEPMGLIGMLQARARSCDGATARSRRRTASQRLLAQVRRSTAMRAARTHPHPHSLRRKEAAANSRTEQHRRAFRRRIRRRFHGLCLQKRDPRAATLPRSRSRLRCASRAYRADAARSRASYGR